MVSGVNLGTGHDETSNSLVNMRDTLAANHHGMPLHIYTDICCSDRNMLEKVFPTLKAHLKSPKSLPIPDVT